MLIIKLLSGCALLGSILWFIAAPDYEPALGIITSLSALVAASIASKTDKKNLSQSQNVAQSGIGIQAGRDISIKTSGKDKNAE